MIVIKLRNFSADILFMMSWDRKSSIFIHVLCLREENKKGEKALKVKISTSILEMIVIKLRNFSADILFMMSWDRKSSIFIHVLCLLEEKQTEKKRIKSKFRDNKSKFRDSKSKFRNSKSKFRVTKSKF